MTIFFKVAESEIEVDTPPSSAELPIPKRGRMPPPPALEQLNKKSERNRLRI
jgi:hypothetical protein